MESRGWSLGLRTCLVGTSLIPSLLLILLTKLHRHAWSPQLLSQEDESWSHLDVYTQPDYWYINRHFRYIYLLTEGRVPCCECGDQRTTCRVGAPFLPCGSRESNSGMGASTFTHGDTLPTLNGHYMTQNIVCPTYSFSGSFWRHVLANTDLN